MLTTKQVLLAKTEVSYATTPAPTPADNSILVENLTWANEGLRMNERPVIKPSLGMLPHIYGGSLRTLTFDVELKGGGATGAVVNVPEISPLLLACGMGTTVTNSVKTYEPASTAISSVYLTCYIDGSLFSVSGARGTVSLNMETGAIPKLSFTFTGHYVQMTAGALPDPTYNALKPVPVTDIDLTVTVGTGSAIVPHAVSAPINTLTLDIGSQLSMRPDMGSTDGFGPVTIVKRDVVGSFDPESLTYIASHANQFFMDAYNTMQTGTKFALTATVADGVVGSEIEIALPNCFLRDVGMGDRDGHITQELSFGCAESTTAGTSGDDEYSISFK